MKRVSFYLLIIIASFSLFSTKNLKYCSANESIGSLESLKISLIKVLDDKKFDEKTKEIFLDTFYAIDRNYYDYECTNIGLPKIDIYLKNNFINLLKDNIDYINIYTRDSEQGRSFLEKIGAAYYMPGLKYISMVPPLKEDINEYNAYLAAVLHEITHSKQENIVIDKDSFLGMILLEGGATYHQRFATKPSMNLSLYESIENPETQMAIYSKSSDEIGYSLYENSFYKLQMLVGYDEMERMQSGGTYDELVSLIDSKYGKGKAKRVLKYMEDSYVKVRASKKERNTPLKYNAAINLEKEILDCIKKDIANLKSREETIKYFNVYRNYKSRYLLNCIKISNVKEDYTNEIFDIASIDDLIEKKVIEFNILSQYMSRSRQENIIKMLLYTNVNNNESNASIPYNLLASKFVTSNLLKKNSLILFDKDEKSIEFFIERSGKIKVTSNKKPYNDKKKIFGYINTSRENKRLPSTKDTY